ncbi:hypothetical protein GMRT_12748 [Giardia muris]|uniref:Nrap protein domain-containing protein n=1 Tax=Giardia muris TaxID=5742 RepID=A0A4Z1SRN7_GIAMU|nr:hypothetical protein GMRT_12748 [Giardia muris]|eukprot:TNJ28584.1 hypothetical protein GMRT_12748 [Giardia muris]
MNSAEEQLAMRQSAEAYYTDVLRKQAHDLLNGLTGSACGDVSSRAAVTAVARELSGFLHAAPDLPLSADLLKKYPCLCPPHLGELSDLQTESGPISLRPVGSCSFCSPWANDIVANVPGALSLYLDICVPLGPLTLADCQSGWCFLKRAIYLAGVLDYFLEKRLAVSKGKEGKAPTEYAEEDTIQQMIYDPRVVHIGVTYLEGYALLPVLTFFLDTSGDLPAGVSLPFSRNFLFRIVPQFTLAPDIFLKRNYTLSPILAFGDSRETEHATYLYDNVILICAEYEQLVAAACLPLATPALREATTLLFASFALNGVAARAHSVMAGVEVEKEDRAFSGLYPTHGITFLGTCAVMTRLLNANDVLATCSDGTTGLRVALMTLAESGAGLLSISSDFSPWLSGTTPSDLRVRNQGSLCPFLLLDVGYGVFYNYLCAVTAGLWRHLVYLTQCIRNELYGDGSSFTLFPSIFQTTNYTLMGGTTVHGFPGFDMLLTFEVKEDFFSGRNWAVPSLAHVIEGLLTQALVTFFSFAENIVTVLHWPGETSTPYINNTFHIYGKGTMDSKVTQPLHAWARPIVVIALKLGVTPLQSVSKAVYRGPKIPSSDGELFQKIFGPRAEKRRFEDGSVNQCLLAERHATADQQLRSLLQHLIIRHFDSMVCKQHLWSSEALLEHFSYLVPRVTDAQVVMTACNQLRVALMAAASDSSELPVDILAVTFPDSYGRLLSTNTPLISFQQGVQGAGEEFLATGRCITTMLTIQSRSAWPNDQGAIACLKTVMLHTLMTHLMTQRPSLRTVAALRSADGAFVTSRGSLHVDNVVYTSYLPSETQYYLRGSCLDLFLPVQHIEDHEGVERPAGTGCGIFFRLFLAIDNDYRIFEDNNSKVCKIRERYYRFMYEVAPAHSRAMQAFAKLNRAFIQTVILAKRWVSAHQIPLYSLTHSFIDTPAHPATSQLICKLYGQVESGEIAYNSFIELLQAEDEQMMDDNGEMEHIPSVFTRVCEAIRPLHTMLPPSARATMGFVSEEAIELIVALAFILHSRNGETQVTSALAGFRAFLAFWIEAYQDRSPFAQEYDLYDFSKRWCYEGRDLGNDEMDNFVISTYQDAVRHRKGSGQFSAENTEVVTVIDILVDVGLLLEGKGISKNDANLLLRTGNRILVKNSRLYATAGNKVVLFSAGMTSNGTQKAYLPPLLLRTEYDPSGSVFTAALTQETITRLGLCAEASLKALDMLFVSVEREYDLRAIFSATIPRAHAQLKVDPQLCHIVRCDNEDRSLPVRRIAPSSLSTISNVGKRDSARQGLKKHLVATSSVEFFERPPVGFSPYELCLPILARSLLPLGAIRVDTEQPQIVTVEVDGQVLKEARQRVVDCGANEMQDMVPTEGGYRRCPLLTLEGAILEAGCLLAGGEMSTRIADTGVGSSWSEGRTRKTKH